MRLSFFRLKLAVFMLWFVSEVLAIPGLSQKGGTNCGTIRTSQYCDVRCAPTGSTGANGLTLRYCTQDLSNYYCDCGCTTTVDGTTGWQVSYYWYDLDNRTCSSGCPPNFYPPVWGSGYACQPCNLWCITCTGGSNTQCTTCNTSAYQLNSTSCYNILTTISSPSGPKINPCPTGYYGLQITKICVACDTGCQTCAIQLTKEMPNGATFGTSTATYTQGGVNCTGNGNDVFCRYTLMCYTCNTGYTLINGFCIPQTSCYAYSYYNSSVGGSFSSANCICFTGFQILSPGNCTKCATNCKTCTGNTSSDCSSCPAGASGSTCGYNTTYYNLVDWTASLKNFSSAEWTITGGAADASVNQGACTSSTYVFGYYGYYNQGVYSFTSALAYGSSLFPTNAKLSYYSAGAFTGINHYGVHIRATILFIDNWSNGISVLFVEGGMNRFEASFQMQGIPGQYLCGYNFYDHHDIVDSTFTHSTAALNLSIYSASAGYQWGIKDLLIQGLKCDASCASCTGPTNTNCLSCTDSTKTVVNGKCVCDYTRGYYLNAGACVTDCGALYKNNFTYTCVSACSFPNYFIYTDANGKFSCVVNCPSSQYKKTVGSNMTCVADCYDTSITEANVATNQFKFDGADMTCYNVCPNGTYGDPKTHSCVRNCSTLNTSTTQGYFASGYYCYRACPTGYAYVPQRACLSSCPSGYYKNQKTSDSSNICEQQCSISLGGLKRFADNSTGSCTQYCTVGTYGDQASNKCLKVCNSTAFGQTLSSQGLCITNCSSANGLYGNPLTGLCVAPASCPTNYYGDPLTFKCTLKCSGATYFGDNSTMTCVTTTCANGAFRQNDTKICVATCLNNNTLLKPEWGDSTSGYCVNSCYGTTPGNAMFGDPQQNNKCVATCAASPKPTFGLNFLCNVNCSNTTWADPFHPNRICTTACTSTTADSYGYNTTRTCVLNCPDGEFAHNVSGIPLCTPGCMQSSGLFGNVLNNRCQTQCPAPFYGDVTGNRICLKKCPWPYYASNCTMSGSNIVISLDRVCRLDCNTCGWADNSSQTCAWGSSGCQNFTFAHQTNHKCVVPTGCTGFADPVSRYCKTVCFSNASVYYFGDPSTKNCVLICPKSPDLFGDNATQTCNLTCSGSYVRDPQYLRRCVNQNSCSRTPVALFGDATKALCVTALNCSDGYYGDNNTFKCVNKCGTSSLIFADNVTKQCVNQCQLGWYGLNITTGQGICSQYCPNGQWADNYTVLCTTRCSAKTYGVNYTGQWTASTFTFPSFGVCQNECPNGQFARDADNLCVTNCGNGGYTNIWGDPLSKTCKITPFDCPLGYYANDATRMCVVPLGCSVDGSSNQFVADNLTKKCVIKCPISVQNFADMAKYLCVAKCPQGFYGYNSTLKCVQQCKYPANNTFDGSFADPLLNICVQICSASPQSLFGQNVTYKCVEAKYCPSLTWAEVTVYSRQCRPICPPPNTYNKGNAQMYADNLTFSCVTQCPTYSYADLSTGNGLCVYVCPRLSNNTLQFADNSTKKCVTVCPANQSTFGDNVTVSCVKTCPLGSYAQVTPYRYCVAVCAVGTWGEDIKRTCVTSPLLCPIVNGSMYYAQNISTMCVKTCPGPTTNTSGSWGENTTRACLSTCLLPNGTQSGFKWNLTRVCIDICPAEIGVDGSYSDQGMCYFVCMTANFYRDPQNKRSCQSSCTFSPQKQYADNTTYRCVTTCPTFPMQYYSYQTTKSCVSTCPSSYRKLQSDKSCIAACPNGTFFNPDTYQCLAVCPFSTSTSEQLFGDTSLSEAKCVKNTVCPYLQYADTNLYLCVSSCSDGQWIDGKNCVYDCPDGYYGNPLNRSCVIPANCPTNYYADNVTQTCVTTCAGSFAYEASQICVLVCPNVSGVLYYADPTTRKCSTSCTYNDTIKLIKNNANQTCVSQCNPSLFFDPFTFNCTPTCSNSYYSDNSTRTCVSICPATPPLFGQNVTYTCVAECLNTTKFQYLPGRVCVYPCPTNYFMENITRDCVTYCPDGTYADINTGYCVSNCTPRYSYDGDNTCVSTCPSPYFKDPTTYKCVFNCPNYPIAYFQVIQGVNRYCDTACPNGQFRDFTTYVCTANCPLSPVTFADQTSGSCLAVCSTSFYGYLTTRTCRSTCPNSMFADPNTRMCVQKCDPKLGFFGDSNKAIPACVATCSSGSYADAYTQTCVPICRNSPKMYAFDNGDSVNPKRQCVYSCPYPWVADNTTSKCFLQCNNAGFPYLDLALKACVLNCSSPVYPYRYMPIGQTVNGECVKFCPTVGAITFFALLSNNSCVTKCPNGFYGSTMNNTCYPSCILGTNTYADPANNLCVTTCTHNSTYFSYANEFTRQCVTTCPTDKGLVGDRLIWKCVKRCSSLSQYADLNAGYCVPQCPLGYFKDNTTQTCISNCSIYTKMYGDIDTRTCVPQCLTSVLYADDATRLCVASTSCSIGFGLNSSRVCVAKCPTTPDLFGDPISRTCLTNCPLYPNILFADPVSRICVIKCPSEPAYYAENTTQRCILFCPNNSYADNYTRLCISVCSIVEAQTFADNTTNLCVKVCPTQPNYYALNYTWQCVLNCPSSPSMYADNSTRSCVYYCPGGIVNTYADDLTRRCVDLCPNATYNENKTRQCLGTCLTGYADPASKYCIAICPHYSYGDNNTKSCVTTCPAISSVQTYAQDGNNICMYNCLPVFRTYADPYTKRCVRICPISQGYFAQPNSRICVAQCPQSPLLFADFSTRFCVPVCPTMPALFAINTSRVCTAVCPNNSYADNNSRICLALCVTSPQTFSDNSTWACVTSCPTKPNYYADNSTHLCVSVCPTTPDFYADNITRKCVYYCPIGTYADPVSRRCVTTCPNTYFGQNSSRRCVQSCPWKQFADNLLHLCVKRCSVDPIFYGNPNTLICVSQCPPNISFGNPLTQECVDYQANGTSGCPIAYFADNSSRLCVEVCPMAMDTYGDNSTWKCVVQCPGGSINTFSDNSTMRCVTTCPSYPDFYAQPFSRRCVHFCLQPNSTFNGSFSDNSTRTCTRKCPSTPDYFSDNSTGRCVLYCPRTFNGSLTFADNSTRRCIDVCPSSPDIYGDPSTLRCVPLCPVAQKTYADNNTRRCVKVCPATPNPPLYADNITQRCLPACPNNSYADNLTRRCVARCPRFPETYADPSTNKCVFTCPSSPDLYADPLTQTCIPTCADGYFAENTTRRCLQQCIYDLVNYADSLTKRCVARCPASQLTYGDNQTQICVTKCPVSPLITYADNVTQTCVKICNNITNGGYADNSTLICVQKCPDRSYGDITTRYCVRYCPVGWYAYDLTNMCVAYCPTPYFADNSTWRCVQQCPVGQNLFGQKINNTCVFVCPTGTYASLENQQCVPRCPNSSQTALKYDTFGYNTTKVCVEQCPVPLYGYPVAQVCVDVCPNPYYQNITDHRCYACPVQCASCTAPYSCLTCQALHYLYSGACVESCPTFPVITYANPNRVCGTASQCTQGYYALNATKSCVSSCPPGTYVNIAGQSCDSCMKGCISCLTYKSCLSCNIKTSIWSNYTCYVFCSLTKKYYTAKGCVATCPNGTYLSLTTCQTCSSVCKTCQVTAENCLICANGYYRSNGICVSQCPSGTIAQVVNGSQTCVTCNPSICKTQPLTYTTTQFVNNYQYNVQIQFSQPVNITKQIDKIIQIQQTNKNRLLATSYTYLDYTIIDYGNGLYNFVLNNYNPSSGSKIQVQIVDPSAIQSASGQMPQTTRAEFEVNSADNYSLEYYNSSIDSYLYAVVMLAIILLVFSFGTHQSIWMPMFDFMQLCMAIILVNVSFPPNLLYTVRSCFVSAFTFLPNLLASSFSQAAFSKDSNNNNIYSLMQDGSFLRVLGSLYTIFIAFLIILLVIYLIGKKSPNKDIKKWAKNFLRQTVWKKHLHGLVHIFFLPVFMLGIYDTSIYKYLGTSTIQIFSIVSSFIFMITFLVIVFYFAYKLRKLAKDFPIAYLMIQKAYNFIAYQKTVLVENRNHYFTHDKNQVDLTNARQVRINELLIFPYPIQTKAGPMEIAFPLLSYLHKLLTALFLALSFNNPVIQIILLILINIAYMVYFIVKKPFFSVKKREFNNDIYIHNLIVVTLIDLVLLVFVFLYSQLQTDLKVLIGNVICALVLYGATVNIIYFFYRTYNFYHHYVWKQFVKTDMFKLNYIIEHLEWTKSYEEEDKKLMSQVKPRSQFLEGIHVETGEALANMVMRAPSISTSTKQKLKAIPLRPSKSEVVAKEFGQLFTHMTNQKEKSHKSIASSQRLSKNERKKVRDTIFGEKQHIKHEEDEYKKLELISQKNQAEQISNIQLSQDNQTEYEYEYMEEQYPDGTPMEQIMQGCAKGNVVMHL